MWQWKNKRDASLGRCPVDQNRETRTKQRIAWPDESHVALLIDGDHNPSQSIDVLQSHAEWLGPLSVQRVYGNWVSGRLGGWERVLSSHRLEARHCGPVAPGKNGADIALTVDAMLLYGDGMRKFVLVASDSDYTPLVEMLCTLGCIVVVIGKASTPLALQQAGHAFRLIDHHLVVPEPLVSVYERPFSTKSVVLSLADRIVGHNSPSEKTTLLQTDATPVQVQQWLLERLLSYEATPYAWVQVPGVIFPIT